MSEDSFPVRWAGQRAVVTLPEHIDVANAGQIREQLLSVISRGASELVADMTVTVSCDHAGADAVARAYQRAAAAGTQLLLVAPAPIVRRVLSINGLDRLIPIYPSLEAATAAAAPATATSPVPTPAAAAGEHRAVRRRSARARRPRRPAGPPGAPQAAAITEAVLRNLLDALADGIVLADDDGVLALVNRQLEHMFGYERGELGQPVESLIPADLHLAHRSHRAAYARAPQARPMGAGARLVGLRKDGATFPVEVSLSPVPTATGHLTLAVVRDATQTRQHNDLAGLARAAASAQHTQRGLELLDNVVSSLFHVGLSLQAAIDLPHRMARQRITDALQQLDDTIQEIRGHMFTASGQETSPHPASPDDAN